MTTTTIGYIGRFGNNLFEYCHARLFAEKYGYSLLSPFPYSDVIAFSAPSPPTTTPPPNPATCYQITEENIDLPSFPTADNYYLWGFFQQAFRYLPYRDQIKSWLPKPYETKNYEDIVIHLRADDYGRAHRIAPKWFFQILRQETYKLIHLVMSPIEPQYLEAFRNAGYDEKNNVVLHSGTIKDDFEFLTSFDKIVVSNSTFSWWAAFLGNASKIYMFRPWLPGIPGLVDPPMPNAIVMDGEFWAEEPVFPRATTLPPPAFPAPIKSRGRPVGTGPQTTTTTTRTISQELVAASSFSQKNRRRR